MCIRYRVLEAKVISTFRFDFLGSGESDLNFKDMTFKDELACARVILEEALKMENCTEIYVLGHSMGGAVASELAKLYPQVISKLVLWAPAFNLSLIHICNNFITIIDFSNNIVVHG